MTADCHCLSEVCSAEGQWLYSAQFLEMYYIVHHGCPP